LKKKKTFIGTIINEYIFKNILWKVLSVCLAALLWLVCVNVVNPVVMKTFTNNLTIRNLDVVEANNYVLLNKDELENQIVVMRVRAVSDSFPQMGSFFTPYIDVSPIDYLSDANIGTAQPLNVRVDHLGNTALSDFNPASIETNPVKVDIKLDKIEEKVLPVTVNITGAPLENYVALPGFASPDTIKVKGPSTVLDGVVSVSVEADVNGAFEDVFLNIAPRIINAEKMDVTAQLTMDVNRLEIKVPINMYAKIPVRQNIKGTPAFGYEMTALSRSMDYIEVVGAPDDITATSYINLPDIDITDFTRSETMSFDVRPGLIDTSLSVVNGTPNEVVVTVTIEKQIVREISYTSEYIRIIGWGYDIDEITLPEDVKVTIRGLATKLINFDEGKILGASIDITGLAPGVYELPVSFLMPAGVYADEEPVVEVELVATPTL